jgi:hypothetical protein
MKNRFDKKTAANRIGLPLVAALLTSASVLQAEDVRYQQVNLISDLPGVAVLQDTNLVNAWGISFSPTSPFWVSDNGTGNPLRSHQ